MWRAVPILFFILHVSAVKRCDTSFWRCETSGECIPEVRKCDNHKDCRDGSDENCGPVVCGLDEFDCGNATTARNCIPRVWVCNNEVDCPSSGLDEDPQLCESITCPQSFTKCGDSGQCILSSWVCDGKRDCANSFDESGCAFKECIGEENHRCLDGKKCIKSSWVCDSYKDCDDGSDEKDCLTIDKESDMVQCKSGDMSIMKDWICDGREDCPDVSDEFNCTAPPKKQCDENSYYCDSLDICQTNTWKCDGVDDCAGGWDEMPERCAEVVCKKNQFRCVHNHYCISAGLRCDGNFDCFDDSDEVDCFPDVLPQCSEFQYRCNDSACIELSQVCDGKYDCKHGEDEISPLVNCGRKNACVEGLCEQNCVETFKSIDDGYKCKCREGFFVDPLDRHKCIDINECQYSDACTHDCHNTLGSFHCSCPEGFTLVSDSSHRCRAKELPQLLFASRERVFTEAMHIMSAPLRFWTTHNVYLADYDYARGRMVYSDSYPGYYNIRVVPLADNGDMNKTLTVNIPLVEGLAMDWVHQNLYFMDFTNASITVIDLKTDKHFSVLYVGPGEPRSLCLDPYEKFMFWTNWGDDATFERAGLDGSFRQTIVQKKIVSRPTALTLDIWKKRIYFVDSDLGMLASVNYQGSDLVRFCSSREILPRPTSITYFEGYAYVIDATRKALLQFDLLGNSLSTGNKERPPIVLREDQSLWFSKVLHSSVQKAKGQENFKDLCQEVQCSYMCLPMPQTHYDDPAVRCVCPPGEVISKDGSNCMALKKNSDTTTQQTEIFKKDTPENKTTIIVATAVGILLAVLIAITVLFFVVRRLRKPKHTMNFDNPVYKRTTSVDSVKLYSGRQDSLIDQDFSTEVSGFV